MVAEYGLLDILVVVLVGYAVVQLFRIATGNPRP